MLTAEIPEEGDDRQGQDINAARYGKRRYKQDAAFLLFIRQEIQLGVYPHLNGEITSNDYLIAETISTLLDRRTWQTYIENARDLINTPGSGVTSTATFRRRLERFRNAPSNDPEEEASEQNPSRLDPGISAAGENSTFAPRRRSPVVAIQPQLLIRGEFQRG